MLPKTMLFGLGMFSLVVRNMCMDDPLGSQNVQKILLHGKGMCHVSMGALESMEWFIS